MEGPKRVSIEEMESLLMRFRDTAVLKCLPGVVKVSCINIPKKTKTIPCHGLACFHNTRIDKLPTAFTVEIGNAKYSTELYLEKARSRISNSEIEAQHRWLFGIEEINPINGIYGNLTDFRIVPLREKKKSPPNSSRPSAPDLSQIMSKYGNSNETKSEILEEPRSASPPNADVVERVRQRLEAQEAILDEEADRISRELKAKEDEEKKERERKEKEHEEKLMSAMREARLKEKIEKKLAELRQNSEKR